MSSRATVRKAASGKKKPSVSRQYRKTAKAAQRKSSSALVSPRKRLRKVAGAQEPPSPAKEPEESEVEAASADDDDQGALAQPGSDEEAAEEALDEEEDPAPPPRRRPSAALSQGSRNALGLSDSELDEQPSNDAISGVNQRLSRMEAAIGINARQHSMELKEHRQALVKVLGSGSSIIHNTMVMKRIRETLGYVIAEHKIPSWDEHIQPAIAEHMDRILGAWNMSAPDFVREPEVKKYIEHQLANARSRLSTDIVKSAERQHAIPHVRDGQPVPPEIITKRQDAFKANFAMKNQIKEHVRACVHRAVTESDCNWAALVLDRWSKGLTMRGFRGIEEPGDAADQAPDEPFDYTHVDQLEF